MRYYRIFLGSGGEHFKECVENNFIGINYGFPESLEKYLSDTWPESRELIKPAYLKFNPNKTSLGAGLSSGALWTFGKGMQRGDIFFCPDGSGNYIVGEITGDYQFEPNSFFPHQRKVQWKNISFPRSETSEEFKRSTGSTLTIIDVTKYAEELTKFIGISDRKAIYTNDENIEDPSVFALEEHLENFLITNWAQTEFANKWDLVTEDGEVVARQYQSDTGPIDILAISKDKREFLVIELKKGRVSDKVVGQILRYMGFVKKDLATDGETVRGAIIALEDDLKLRNALSMVQNIDFYRYKIDFKLNPISIK